MTYFAELRRNHPYTVGQKLGDGVVIETFYKRSLKQGDGLYIRLDSGKELRVCGDGSLLHFGDPCIFCGAKTKDAPIGLCPKR